MAAKKTTAKKKTTKKTKEADPIAEARKIAAQKKKEAEAAARKAEREAKKAQEEAEKRKAKEKAEQALERDAKEINTRFEKAEKLGGQADDHRLAASLKLAEAKNECKAAGVKWADWVKENIKQSYDYVNKLVKIGATEAENPGEGVKMLEDMRKGGAARVKKHREQQKQKAKSNNPPKTTKTEAPADRALAALDSMKKDEKTNLVKSIASDVGLKLASDGEKQSAREAAEAAFKRMSQKGMIEFLKWAADQVGGEFILDTDMGDEKAGDGEMPDIPESMKRTEEKTEDAPKRRRRKKAA